jgi:nicotinate phosphoribosyltransferase
MSIKCSSRRSSGVFFGRFDLHEVQAADGYAYNIAVQRFNLDHAKEIGPYISTDAQGDWWGGAGGGTVAHAAIASFLGDTAEAMLQFARVLPASIPRIALVDFNNDSVQDSLLVLNACAVPELMDAGRRGKTWAPFYGGGWIRAAACGCLSAAAGRPR